MDYSVQFKVRGDDFGGHFITGISMADSESVWKCKLAYADDEKNIYESADGYKITAYHIRKGDVTECFTVFENCTDKTVTLDMISSFCLTDIDSDILHRATSFWSAEGKLLSQKLTELNMERSWSGHGIRIEKFGQTGSMPVRKWFPFVCLENSSTKEFIGVQLYIPSSWQVELFRHKEPLTLLGGIADFDYGHWCKEIAPGESFTTPKAVIAEGDSLLKVCDMLVKAQNPDISPVDADLPVIFNEYCTSWGNPTIENLENTATIKGCDFVGGLFGAITPPSNGEGDTLTVRSAKNSGNVSGNDFVGGLIGSLYLDGSHAIIHYDFPGYIIGGENSGMIRARSCVGGLVGYGRTDTALSEIIDPVTTGEVVGEDQYGAVGGSLENLTVKENS